MSYESDLDNLKSFFRHELDSDFKWYLNGAANWLGVPVPGKVDVDKAVQEARVRSVWAHGVSTHWLRKAVTDACQDERLRGPGIVFVPCGFRPNNSVYTSDHMIAGDYKHPASDPLQGQRQRRTPRVDALQDLRKMWENITIWDKYEGAKALRNKIDGPKSLKAALFSRSRERGLLPEDHLDKEIYRIQRALTASLFHPTEHGHRQYAKMAISRYQAYLDAVAQLPRRSGPLSPDLPNLGGVESVDERLKRFGLRGSGPLEADLGHEFVDAVRVTVGTASDSQPNFAQTLQLVFVLRAKAGGHHDTVSIRLNLKPHIKEVAGITLAEKFYRELEPRNTDEFCADISGHSRTRQVLLKDVIGLNLAVAAQLETFGGGVWGPTDVVIEINGITVVRRNLKGHSLRNGDSIDLNYPPPEPEVDIPTRSH